MNELSPTIIQLLRGPVYRDTHEAIWPHLLRQRAQVGDYVATIGLRVEIDESDGFAYLASLPDDNDRPSLPRLVRRHKLPFHTSMLLAILRKRLAEFEAETTEGQLVVTTAQLTELMRLYLPESNNDVKLQKDIETNISRVKDLGFLRQLQGASDNYEVRPILRAFVDGQFLAELDAELDRYLAMLGESVSRR